MQTQQLYAELTMQPIRKGPGVLPGALFDLLKTRADAAGGIGYGTSRDSSRPRCIGDFAAAIDGRKDLSEATVFEHPSAFDVATKSTPAVQALRDAIGPYFGTLNDNAVLEINARKRRLVGALNAEFQPRVTFDELAAELGLVRGEA